MVHSLSDREESPSNQRQLALKDHIQTVLQCVGAYNPAPVRVYDDTTASAAILHSQKAILDHTQRAGVVASCLLEHDISEFSFAFWNNAFDKIDFIFSNFELKLRIKQLDHTLQ